MILTGIGLPIWRRLLVRSDITLATFHQILQTVMGWTDKHLHHFTIAAQVYGPPEHEDARVVDESAARLGSFLVDAGTTFGYTYDVGDNWRHAIVVEDACWGIRRSVFNPFTTRAAEDTTSQ